MQASFSDLKYASKQKRTRRDRFLTPREALTPWAALVNLRRLPKLLAPEPSG